MSLIATHLLVVLLFFTSICAAIDQNLLNYTITAIEYLANHQVGTFRCVFYDLSDDDDDDGRSFEGDFYQVLKSPRLDSNVVKYVLNSDFTATFNSSVPQSPSLMVIHLNGTTTKRLYEDSTVAMFRRFNPNTRLMVICSAPRREYVFSWSFCDSIRSNNPIYNRVVHMWISEVSVIRLSAKCGIADWISRWEPYPHPRDLFKDVLRDMRGQPIIYSSRETPSVAKTKWMEGTARYLNATAHYSKNPCPGTDLSCYLAHLRETNVVLPLDDKYYSGLEPAKYYSLFNAIPVSSVIIVPRARSLNAFEMFAWPFEWPVWTLLFVILFTVELISRIFPSLFKSDPLLQIVFRQERKTIQGVTPILRIIQILLTTFIFLLFNVYESSIISAAINNPTQRSIKTFEDLFSSGIKLKTPLHERPWMVYESSFGKIVQKMNENDLRNRTLDDLSAYLGERRETLRSMLLPANYDFQRWQTKYQQLRQPYPDTHVKVFEIMYRDSLLEKFDHTQRVFFEAGLLTKWERDELWHYFISQLTPIQKGQNVSSFSEVGHSLSMENLLPVWTILAVGLVASLITWIFETYSVMSK